MVSTMRPNELSMEEIARLRRQAFAAEPYPPDDPIWEWFDGEYTKEEIARMRAADAREILAARDIPLTED